MLFRIQADFHGFRHRENAQGAWGKFSHFLSSPGVPNWINPLSDPHTFSCAGNGATGALGFGAANLFDKIKVLFLIFCYFPSGLNEIKQN